MTTAPVAVSPEAAGTFARAIAAADLLAVDPSGLGGIHLKARAGPVRDAWLAAFRARLPLGAPIRRIPANISDDRLIGGLDLVATLAAGRPVLDRGVLATLDGGVAVLAMAERLARSTVAHLAHALDAGEVALERDGFAARLPARVGIVAFDESTGEDEPLAAALRDRLAFALDLDDVAARAVEAPAGDPDRILDARRTLARRAADPDLAAQMTEAALVLGIDSVRAPLFAMKAAHAAAALEGRAQVSEADAILAVELVLLPRATRFPTGPDEDSAPDDTPETPPREPDAPSDTRDAPSDGGRLDAGTERLVESALAAMPQGLLDGLQRGDERARAAATRGAGARQVSGRRGRPVGVHAGRPVHGARLSVIDTVKAAAPWQTVRRGPAGDETSRLRITPDDFRIRRYKDRRETVTVFVVDASGSAANARLAEAKGAVELMLGETYAQRGNVALLAFRGTGAELILPPTRSLTRAKRLLATLPGGGGTPLATALDAARLLCEGVARKGRTASIVVLSDGRANVGRDGRPGRDVARTDALDAARAVRAQGFGLLFVDTSRRSGDAARHLAEAAAGRYLWLPNVEARAITAAARTA